MDYDDYWYHQDDLFSTMAVTDGAGAVVERYEYGDYGSVMVLGADNDPANSPGASQIDNAFLFTGRYYDAETGLHYYRTRYLEPSLGRFTTRDTIGVWGDSRNLGNAASYVALIPTRFVDPMGLEGGYHRDLWPKWPENPFDPLNDPVSPAEPRFLPLPGKDGAPPTEFSEPDKQRIRDALQSACERAQCALRALQDQGIRKNLRGTKLTDLDKLQYRLERYIRTFCSGEDSRPIKFRPTHERDTYTNVPLWGPWDRTIHVPVKDGSIPERRRLTEDCIHEPFHGTYDTLDDGSRGPDDNQHDIDIAIKQLCTMYQNKQKR